MTAFDLAHTLLVFVAFKALTIGSDFNLVTFIRQPKAYWYWYTNRQTFRQHQFMNKLFNDIKPHLSKMAEFKVTDKEEN